MLRKVLERFPFTKVTGCSPQFHSNKRSTSSYVIQDLKVGYFSEPKNFEGKKN